MSGGYFKYDQWRVNDIHGRGYSPETLARFREAVAALNRAAKMAQRVDWLLSGDDSEESFHRRWDEEIEKQEPFKWPNP